MMFITTHIKLLKKKYFFPITWTFILFVLLDILMIRFYSQTNFEDTFSYTYAPFLELVLWLILIVIHAIFFLNLLLFLFSLTYLHWGMKSDTNRYFHFIHENHMNYLHVSLPIWVRPLFGFIAIEIELKDDEKENRIFSVKKNNTSIAIPLTNIQEYKIIHLSIRIMDMFQFFLWKRKWNVDRSIIQYPVSLEDFSYKIKIDRYKKSEDNHSLKKVFTPGEWLNFKNFETGDDVKRILWKIFAKNRTLMVRHRELIDYDNTESHIYCSFFIENKNRFWGNEHTVFYALDVYKNLVWNTIQTIQSTNKDIIIHFPRFETLKTNDEIKEKLVMQDWMYEKDDWDIRHQSISLIIPDVMCLDVLKKIIDKFHSKISYIILIDTLQGEHEKVWLKWLRKIFIKSNFYQKESSILLHSQHILSNKNELMKYIQSNTEIPMEILSFTQMYSK